MPKKSKKSKSRRTTLRQKYKILRKVREHHRKKRKDAKKSGLKRREPKDPGIPNAWPFKQELIQQLAAQKERAAERMRKIKEESFKRASQVRGGRRRESLVFLMLMRSCVLERRSCRNCLGFAGGRAPRDAVGGHPKVCDGEGQRVWVGHGHRWARGSPGLQPSCVLQGLCQGKWRLLLGQSACEGVSQ